MKSRSRLSFLILKFISFRMLFIISLILVCTSCNSNSQVETTIKISPEPIQHDKTLASTPTIIERKSLPTVTLAAQKETTSPEPTLNTPQPTPTPSATPTIVIPIYVFPLQTMEGVTYVKGHHDYPAVDIFAPVGTPFVAVTNGIIDFVSDEDRWDPAIDDPATRGGIAVAIIGDDGIRYYGSHLSAILPEVKPDLKVSAGQVIGFVGNSGNARYVASHLHFGISHPTFPDDWQIRRGEVDPFPYLKAWEKGEMLKPDLGSTGH